MIKVNGKKIELEKFFDGTPRFSSIPSITNSVTNYHFTWLYENNEELVYLIFLVEHYKENAPSNAKFSLTMPYVPNARMDRIKSNKEVFTLKHFCKIINSLNFDYVKIFDVHSNVTPALLNHVKQDSRVTTIINKAIRKYNPDVLFFPDEGSHKRYAENIKNLYDAISLQMPHVAYANKDRDWSTGTIKGLSIANGEIVKDKNVLIIDDICCKGGTFLSSAEQLKELGANDIYLYVSHCENTILDGKLIESGLIKEVYTTNSIFTKNHKTIFVDEVFY